MLSADMKQIRIWTMEAKIDEDGPLSKYSNVLESLLYFMEEKGWYEDAP